MEDQQWIKASRIKLRFNTSRGQLGIEELWDLDLQSLDAIARAVKKMLNAEDEESFLSSSSTKKIPTYNDLRLDILKYVIATKEQQDEDRKQRLERLNKISQLEELISKKAVEELEGKSVKELSKEIEKLKALV